MITIVVTILSVCQIVFLIAATYFTFKIAGTAYTPTRAWYLLSLGKAIFVFQKIYSLFFLSQIRSLSIQYGAMKILFNTSLQTIVFLCIFIGMAEIYAIMKVKYDGLSKLV